MNSDVPHGSLHVSSAFLRECAGGAVLKRPPRLSPALRRFYRKVRLRNPRCVAERVLRVIIHDSDRWMALGGPMFRNAREVLDFLMYLLEGDSLLDHVHVEPTLLAELRFKVAARRDWALFASESHEFHWPYSLPFTHYDVALERHFPDIGEVGHRRCVLESAAAFLDRQLSNGALFYMEGARHIRHSTSGRSKDDFDRAMRILSLKIVAACGPEARSWGVPPEALVLAAINPPDARQNILSTANAFQRLWELVEEPVFDTKDVEDFICFGLYQSWVALPGYGAASRVIRASNSIRSLAEALMSGQISVVSDFATQLAKYDPLAGVGRDVTDPDHLFQQLLDGADRFTEKFDEITFRCFDF